MFISKIYILDNKTEIIKKSTMYIMNTTSTRGEVLVHLALKFHKIRLIIDSLSDEYILREKKTIKFYLLIFIRSLIYFRHTHYYFSTRKQLKMYLESFHDRCVLT
jgi:hypothetical protein